MSLLKTLTFRTHCRKPILVVSLGPARESDTARESETISESGTESESGRATFRLSGSCGHPTSPTTSKGAGRNGAFFASVGLIPKAAAALGSSSNNFCLAASAAALASSAAFWRYSLIGSIFSSLSLASALANSPPGMSHLGTVQ